VIKKLINSVTIIAGRVQHCPLQMMRSGTALSPQGSLCFPLESYPLHSSIDTLATGRGDRPTSADYSDPDDAVSMGDSEVHRGLSHVDDENDLQGKSDCERSPKCVFQ